MNAITLKNLWSTITHDTTALLRQQVSLTPITAKASARRILDPLQTDVAAWHDEVTDGKATREEFAQRLVARTQEAAGNGLTAMGLPRSRRNKLIKSIHDIVVPRFTATLEPAASASPTA